MQLLLENRDILSRKGVSVFSAASAGEILQLHREKRGDLIIADLDMEGMSGDELCTAIREDDHLKTVAIIMVCAGDRATVERCQACGANSVIAKPVNPDELFSRIMDLLNVSGRKNLRGLVKVSVKGTHRGGFSFAISENASASGILLETDRVFAKGDRITCSFVLKRKITVEGEVVRAVRKSAELYHYGIRFLDLDPRSREELEEFVRSQKRP